MGGGKGTGLEDVFFGRFRFLIFIGCKVVFFFLSEVGRTCIGYRGIERGRESC